MGVYKRERQEGQSQRRSGDGNRDRFEDALLLVFKIEEEALDQVMQAAARS